jgi:outer membrane receptor protein involved in Fe transport
VFVGNPDLKLEDSLGYEIGADLRPGGAAPDLIVGFADTAINILDTSTRRGPELSLDHEVTDWLRLAGAYTRMDARRATGEPVGAGRPARHVADADPGSDRLVRPGRGADLAGAEPVAQPLCGERDRLLDDGLADGPVDRPPSPAMPKCRS